ncbi:MAG: glucose-6-phosphate dehydrogenase assembly protein OpcA [Micromonosporaceae bacterium]|nr:glucose-6-phosphate dehydrogenase assembly protein OpcA [Micromonosporaceae bacterium]
MLTLWDTTGTEVVHKLSAERRSAGGVTSGLALTLIAVADEPNVRAVEDAVTIAAAEHPCRLLVVTRALMNTPGVPDRLDAEIVVGGRLGPCEAVLMRMQGRLALHAESVVMPLLAPDVPVVTWWHGAPPERIAYDPLGVVAERRVTDVTHCPDPIAALRQRAEDYAPGDTDLAWTRITPWRSLIAGAFDTISANVVGATITAGPADPRAKLLAGWLTARLGITPRLQPNGSDELEAVSFSLDDGGSLNLSRKGNTAVLHRPGYEDRVMPLVGRRLGEELAEELRRLDADQPYAAALAAAYGIEGLAARPRNRIHIWQDPDLAERPEAASRPSPAATAAAGTVSGATE